MTGVGGFTLPPIIRKADELLDKLKAYKNKARKTATKGLIAETEEVIDGLKEHAKSEFTRGVKVGKDAAWQAIRNKFESSGDAVEELDFNRIESIPKGNPND